MVSYCNRTKLCELWVLVYNANTWKEVNWQWHNYYKYQNRIHHQNHTAAHTGSIFTLAHYTNDILQQLAWCHRWCAEKNCKHRKCEWMKNAAKVCANNHDKMPATVTLITFFPRKFVFVVVVGWSINMQITKFTFQIGLWSSAVCATAIDVYLAHFVASNIWSNFILKVFLLVDFISVDLIRSIRLGGLRVWKCLGSAITANSTHRQKLKC